jgi:hypothetical protein
MALDNKQVAKELISYTIVTDKNAIVNLLAKNGVRLNSNPSNSEVTTAVLVANQKSGVFKDDLAKLLASKVSEAGESFSNIVGNDQDFGFTGVDDVTYFPNVMSFTGMDDYQNAGGNIFGDQFTKDIAKAKATGVPITSGTKPQTKVGSALSSLWSFAKDNIFTKDNINAGIQVGLNKINTDTARKQVTIEQQRAELEAQQNVMRNKIEKSSGVSGMTILYVVIGLIAITGIGYIVYKKTKK